MEYFFIFFAKKGGYPPCGAERGGPGPSPGGNPVHHVGKLFLSLYLLVALTTNCLCTDLHPSYK